ANGCSATAKVTITQPTPLMANITVNTNVSCYGGTNGSAYVTASGGTAPYAYQWSNGATTSSIKGLAAATYSVFVTDANGCSATAKVTITQPSTPLIATVCHVYNVSC